MHSGILRTSGIIHSLPVYLISELVVMITDLPIKLQEIHNVVSRNRIWLTRLASVGIISKKNWTLCSRRGPNPCYTFLKTFTVDGIRLFLTGIAATTGTKNKTRLDQNLRLTWDLLILYLGNCVLQLSFLLTAFSNEVHGFPY